MAQVQFRGKIMKAGRISVPKRLTAPWTTGTHVLVTLETIEKPENGSPIKKIEE